MRIPSGTVDQYIYFFAADATDFVTPETGLSSFTVRRSRNGGASAAMTTPTINETDVTNMPGWYELLLDEDMTIDSGDDSQEMAFHITHAGMAPARRVIELYRPKITVGETLTVASGIAQAAVQSIAAGAITAASIAADALTAAKVAADVGTEIATAVWASATRLLTAGTNIALAKGTGVTGFNDLSAAEVNAEVDTAISDAALATAANLATVAGYLDTEITAIKAKTDSLTFTVAGQVDANVQYVNDTAVAGDGEVGTEWGPAP